MTQEELTKVLMESYKRGQSDLIKSCHETISIAVHAAILSEREACVKVCEEQMQGKSIWIEGAKACSLAIRARGQA